MIPEFVTKADPDLYLSDNYVVLDFETDTSHGDFGHPVWPENQILLGCYKLGLGHPHINHQPGVTSVWADELGYEELLHRIDYADVLVCHNSKYELGWLKRAGLDLSQVLTFCTQIAEFVLSGNLVSLNSYSVSLDNCCIRRGWKQKDPVVDHLIKADINPIRIPQTWLQGRCEQDVTDTERLFLHQRASLSRQTMLPVVYTRCLLTPVLADIEFNGMRLDKERVLEEHLKETKRFAKSEAALQEISGINWNSDKQKGEFIYGELGFEEAVDRKGKPIRTAGGQHKTDGDTLAALKSKTPEQRKFIKIYRDYNQSMNALSKSLDFFKGVVEETDDHVFKAVFNQTVAATHRLSSSGLEIKFEQFEKGKRAQFQNLANAYKRLFKARREDYLFCEWDGSGLEFRGAGLISGDPMIMQDINDPNFDPHRRSASVINGITEDEVTKEQRRKAKANTFKPLFGGVSGTRNEQRYYRSFNERYSGLAKAQEAWAYQVVADKFFRTPWGLTFRFPYARMEKDGYINVKTNVYNYPIQSISTAEIIPLAVVYFYHLVKDAGLEDKIVMVNTIHDSVLCEVHEDYLDIFKDFAQRVWLYVYWYFEEVYRFPLVGLPLGTEVTWGSHWSEGQEESWNIYQDGRIEAA